MIKNYVKEKHKEYLECAMIRSIVIMIEIDYKICSSQYIHAFRKAYLFYYSITNIIIKFLIFSRNF